jgi:hypothetical protein
MHTSLYKITAKYHLLQLGFARIKVMRICNFNPADHHVSGMNFTKRPKAVECSDVLCLVQAILSKTPQIVLLDDIDVSGTDQLTQKTSFF